ncbi:hypothetical protein ACFY00_12090 [Kitasatospora sp. NPDC001540]|uniref:hypothetical protein n=1 Tax=Kitasatospora sp. NPDC001540 TaxID=3364014 RepID=UPI00369ADE5A
MAEMVEGGAVAPPKRGSAGAERSPRVVGVVPWGAAAGALAWGLAGAWRAGHEANYPWNVWTPIGYGAVKGVFLGLLAGWCATLVLRLLEDPGRGDPAGPAASGPAATGPAATGALLGGLAPGTVRDFLGEPRPRTLYYFDAPRPAAEWYWTPLLTEWLTQTLLPALGCALLLAAAVRALARLSRPRSSNWVALALTGTGLLVLPAWATAGLPAPEGNGGHVDESAMATMTVWGVALGVMASASVSLVRLRRTSRG